MVENASIKGIVNRMAYQFFGVFSTGQFEQLRIFAKVQERDLTARIAWLSAQLQRNGLFSTIYDQATNMPISYDVAPPNSYAAKLLVAYRALGGVPEKDFLLRTSDQPVYLTRTDNINPNEGSNPTSGYSDVFTNGRRIRGSQKFDRDIGVKVDRFKSWQLEAIKHKREHLEFKIKRALDYSDQLQSEINAINVLLDTTSNATVDDQIRTIQQYMFRTGASNVISNLADVFGLSIGRVFDVTNPTDYEIEQGVALR